MNAESANRWLTLAANSGVLVGLIILVFELDQNNDLVRAQIHQARSDAHVQTKWAGADTEFLLPALVKFESAGGLDNPDAMDGLSPIEASRVMVAMEADHQDYDNLFYQYQHGYLDKEYYEHRIVPTIVRLAPWWKKLDIYETSGRRPSFDAEIRRLLSESR